MKKILLVIFSFFILCKTVNASFIVYDMDNNRVLKSYNENEQKKSTVITHLLFPQEHGTI